METNRTSKIALLIKGTQLPTSGLQPLVSVGVMPTDEIALMDERRMVNEPLVYTIHHGAEHLCYTLYDNKVHPNGSARQGLLVISIAIPRTLCLSSNLSPYTILQEVYHTFVAIYMYANPDGSHIFKEGDYDRSIIMGLLSKYRLNDRSTSYVPMTPTGGTAVVCVDDDTKLTQLMLDSQYPEFQPYKRVEIGHLCAPTVNIEIPRPREYKVYVNGVELKRRLVKRTDSFDSKTILKDDEYYTINHVSFTLQELIDKKGSLFNGRVVIDGEIIKCIITKERKRFEFTTEIKPTIGHSLTEEDKKNILQWLIDGKLCIKYGPEDISQAFVKGHSFILFGEDIKQQVTLSSFKIDDYLFNILNNKAQKNVILYVEKASAPKPERRPEPKPKPVPKPTNPSYLEVRFVSHEPIGDKELVATVTVEDDKNRYIRTVLQFSAIQQNGKRLYHASIILDENWNNVFGFLTAKIEDEYGFQSESIPLNFRRNKVAEIDITNIQYFKKQNRFYLKMPFLYSMAALVIVIVMVIGFSFGYFFADGKTYDTTEDTKALQEQVEGLREDNEKLVKEIESLKKQLDEAKAKEQTNPIAKQEPSIQESIPPTTVDYKSQIVELFNNRDYTRLNDVLTKAIKAKQITPEQRDKICIFWWNPEKGKNGKYSPAQQKRIVNFLRGKTFKSVDEIVRAADELSQIL